jgi:two-component system, NtrC family, nitrogen regulation sensor histidine kinase NtrY
LSFRKKLLLMFALTVFVSVAAIGWFVSSVTRRAFDRSDEQRTQALVAQFRREFTRRGEDVARRVEAAAASEAATRMALSLSRGVDYGAFLSDAKAIADNRQLDFLEFVDSQGIILSSAQSPAKFGYKTASLNLALPLPREAYLAREELAEGSSLGLFAARTVKIGDKPLYVVGGRRVDKDFLSSLDLPPGMRVLLYQNLAPGFSSQFLIDPSATLQQQSEKFAPLILNAQQPGSEPTEVVHWSSDALDDETVHAIPLRGQDAQLLGVLLVGNARRPSVELERRIRSASLLIGGGAILLAILLSSWMAARVTRPVEQLAEAARQVAAGDWNTRVDVASRDELGELAEAFNRMTDELLGQKDRLVQTERVAAWRELARRLAHELKNPLFPLQLTVENLLRARQQRPELFDEIFRESTSTLLAEIANLKTIVGRFSEFSKMPEPRFQRIDLNELVQGALRLFQAQLQTPGRPAIACSTELDDQLPTIAGDPDLLHKAISNLVLNAMDAMPEGGGLALRTSREGSHVRLEVSDTGRGLTPEECDRLFTPYYTSKQHGTGLGLAIVQSVVSDHGGKVNVTSAPGRGTTFVIELPRNLDKLTGPVQAEPATTGLIT